MPKSTRVVRLLATSLAALLFVATASPMAAQGATPAAGFPITPDPALCQVEPRPSDELLALWYSPEGTPLPATPMAGAGATSVTIPLGPRADEATTMVVVTLVSEIFSCFAAGDFPRAIALFSDDLIRSFGPEPGTSMEDARAFLEATPMPEEGEASQIVAITDVMELSDGRVGAIVVESLAGQQDAVYAIFAQEGDRWLVDEIIDFAPVEEMEGEGS
jgi:hypothetical protein